jgi:hypothetical protein
MAINNIQYKEKLLNEKNKINAYKFVPLKRRKYYNRVGKTEKTGHKKSLHM